MSSSDSSMSSESSMISLEAAEGGDMGDEGELDMEKGLVGGMKSIAGGISMLFGRGMERMLESASSLRGGSIMLLIHCAKTEKFAASVGLRLRGSRRVREEPGTELRASRRAAVALRVARDEGIMGMGTKEASVGVGVCVRS